MNRVEFSVNGKNNIVGTLYQDREVTHTDSGTDVLDYLSVIGDENVVKTIISNFNHGRTVVATRSMSFDIQRYHFDYSASNSAGLSHIVFYRKAIANNDYVNMPLFLEQEDAVIAATHANEVPTEVIDMVYQHIAKHSTIPVIEDWKGYIVRELVSSYCFRRCYIGTARDISEMDYGFKSAYYFSARSSTIIDIIKRGLANRAISIDGCNEKSYQLDHVTGFNSYIEAFGQNLAQKITDTFTPLFNPASEEISENVEDFSDIVSTHTDVLMFETQKNAVEASVRSMRKNKHTIISGEMGVGKSLMATASVSSHASKPNFSCLIMCPGTMPENWKHEIERFNQFSEVYIINSMLDLFELKKKIQDPYRKRSIWGIVTYGTVKSDYTEHPAAVWSKAKGCFVCPDCGQPIRSISPYNERGERTGTVVYGRKSDLLSFLDQDDKNTFCNNKIEVKEGDEVHSHTCNARLWTMASKKNIGNWIRLKKIGWVLEDKLADTKLLAERRLNMASDKATATYKKELRAVIQAIEEYERTGNSVVTMPARYSIARYIAKHMKNVFDYTIFDEVHKLAGDSAQGKAFGDICNASKKTLSLTGTISNGYSSGLFHLLFRTQTKNMLEDGFGHKSESDFVDRYGVSETTKKDYAQILWNQPNEEGGYRYATVSSAGGKRKKEVAGVNPAVFPNYLMNNTVFISQKDITEDLVPYTEIPIGVQMDAEQSAAYTEMFDIVTQRMKHTGKLAIGSTINYLSMFLDQPYGLDGVVDNNGNEVIAPVELSDTVIRAKEQELINLAIRKKEAGEKMLVYTHWTNILNTQNRLKALLEENNIRADIMQNVKQEKRQEWINDKAKDVDVLILNPKLIEIGLNLLDYTTIVFYQMGNELSVIRQASRRSWRLNQTKPVEVYFLYYANTIQEQLLAAISSKLKAASAIEGNFSEEGLSSVSNDSDIMTQMASNIANNVHIEVNANQFEKIGSMDAIENRKKRLEGLVRLDNLPKFSYKKSIVKKPQKFDFYAAF